MSIYTDLPDDPEQAFIILESHFRDLCDEKLRNMHQDDNPSIFYVEYIGRVLAAIEELGLSTVFNDRVPKIGDVNYATYLDFNKDVEHYKTMLQIRHSRRAKGYSVRFDEVTRQKIKHHLQQIREIVVKMEIDEQKRDALLVKINTLDFEVDRERTGLDVFGDFVVGTAGILGEAAEKAEPIRKWIDSIAGLIWGARKEDESKKLPAPPERKQIEPPRSPQPKPGSSSEMDDDIPF
jgi:hypothetical protein